MISNTFNELWQICGVSSPDYMIDAEHVLIYFLSLNCGSIEAVWPFLSNDEKKRAISYGRDLDRLYFAVSRALLRGILGFYSGIDPNKLIFCYGPHGRPYLQPWQANGLDFNLARRDSCYVIGLALDRRIGIDIESCHNASFVEPMLTILPVEDQAIIASTQGLDRSRNLISAWTKLEAKSKAIGIGLNSRNRYIDMLEYQHFALGNEWIGCVAAEDNNWQIKLIRWNA